MASQLRVNKSENRSGLGTITYTDTGAIVSGIVTANSFSGDVIGGTIAGSTGTFQNFGTMTRYWLFSANSTTASTMTGANGGKITIE